MIENFYSNGNLIITGEYFVLKGAKALISPLTYGQSMSVEYTAGQDVIRWYLSQSGVPLFKADIDTANLCVKDTDDQDRAAFLLKVFIMIDRLRPGIWKQKKSATVRCDNGFNINLGWGSSASFLLNLANWTGVDPFVLNSMISKGSGYDIAAAGTDKTSCYYLRNGTWNLIPVRFLPPFREALYFIYTGRKKDTVTGIDEVATLINNRNETVNIISSLTEKMTRETVLDRFMSYMHLHEKIVSDTLALPRVKEQYFNDFDGEIKSLGAWGGDTVMAASHMDETSVKEYFRDKGLEEIFAFDELIRS